ncbi:SpoIIE family protein phosphatase [Oscillatoriales cyanobacterium LEGE 11467]|uniref:SpoIIE family protein phosphatase n=2 Tax=Zarconia TaxID=2992130 RepID=A0A928ZA03_9CYAN|nr:SpoIIE family protein phosphatase [Zarconia navalis LEGE 11467]
MNPVHNYPSIGDKIESTLSCNVDATADRSSGSTHLARMRSFSTSQAMLPSQIRAIVQNLRMDSTLDRLHLFECSLDLSAPGKMLREAFDRSSVLPGVILTAGGEFKGMISRRRFLELMSRPYSIELFTRRPIEQLYSFIQSKILICPGQMPIVEAAMRCLERSPECLYEPLVVELAQGEYRLVDLQQLLVAQSHIHQLTTQLVKKRTVQLDRANAEITLLNQRLQAENLRLSAEIEVTHRLQTMLLPQPQELCQIPGLEISGFMEPAAEVGGDYYDVLTHHNGRALIGIGDVTGHGLESGVLMLMVQTAVRTLLEHDETDPAIFLDVLNRTIYKNVRRMNSDKNLSLALLEYDRGQLHLSGQHEEIVVVRANRSIERIDTLDLGFPLGLEERIDEWIDRKTIQLQMGDGVVLYTDGITEAQNDSGEFYGLERLCRNIGRVWNASARGIGQAVVEDWRAHVGGHKVYDDITLLVLKQIEEYGDRA